MAEVVFQMLDMVVWQTAKSMASINPRMPGPEKQVHGPTHGLIRILQVRSWCP